MPTPAERTTEPAPLGNDGPHHGAHGGRPMTTSVWLRLAIMMFLQYFCWGAWFPMMGTYMGDLGFTEQIGYAYGTAALAAMIAPFFVGMVADRLFATQHILAALHLVGAALLFAVTRIHNFPLFYVVLLGYFLCFMPTLALTNSISFHNMTNAEKQFPGIRVLGTIGWIAAGLFVGFQSKLKDVLPFLYLHTDNIEHTNMPMIVGAVTSLILGLYCLALPHTPPPKAGHKVAARDVLGLDALALMKEPSFAVFVIFSFLVCIPLQFYYAYANVYFNEIGILNAGGKMTFGQMSEIFFMLIMPLLFIRLGVKWMLLVGMVSWALRYVLFAYGDADQNMWMIYAGILLHGICYDFFFVTGYIYVDRKAPAAIRGAAQGFIAFVTLGLGGLIGTTVAGWLVEAYATSPKVHDWRTIWLWPAGAAFVMTLLFAAFFNDRKIEAEITH